MAGPHHFLGNDVGNEGVWNLAANWLTGLIPASGEDLIFDGNAANAVLTSPVGGKDEFGSVIFTGGFAKDLGSDSVTIAFDVTTATKDLIIDASAVPSYFKLSGKFSRITVIKAKGGSNACVLSGNITALTLIKGEITLIAGTIVNRINVDYATSQAADVDLTIPAGCIITDIYQRGGDVDCASAIAGQLDIDTGIFNHTIGNMSNLNVRGGTYNWNAANYTIEKVNLFGGVFDCRGDSNPKTIVHFEIWPNAEAYLNNGGQNINLLNPGQYHGGRLYFDKGSYFDINLPFASDSPSASPSASGSPSSTPCASPSPTPSATPSVSPSGSPSMSPAPSGSPSVTPSTSPSASSTPCNSPSPTPSASSTPCNSPSPTPSMSPAPSSSPSAS